MSNEQLRVSHRCKLELERELSQMRIERDRYGLELRRMLKLVEELQAVHFVCFLCRDGFCQARVASLEGTQRIEGPPDELFPVPRLEPSRAESSACSDVTSQESSHEGARVGGLAAACRVILDAERPWSSDGSSPRNSSGGLFDVGDESQVAWR